VRVVIDAASGADGGVVVMRSGGEGRLKPDLDKNNYLTLRFSQ